MRRNPTAMAMFDSLDIAPRAALAAPTDPFVMYSQSTVIVVVSVLSAVGAGWMVASFLVRPPKLSRLTTHLTPVCPDLLEPSKLPPPTHPRASHQRLCHGLEFPLIFVHERGWTVDRGTRASHVLHLQRVHDADFCHPDRLLGVRHRRLHLLCSE